MNKNRGINLSGKLSNVKIQKCENAFQFENEGLAKYCLFMAGLPNCMISKPELRLNGTIFIMV